MLKNFLFVVIALAAALLHADAVRVELHNPCSGEITYTTKAGAVDHLTTIYELGRIVKSELHDHFQTLSVTSYRGVAGRRLRPELDVAFLRKNGRAGAHDVLPLEEKVLPPSVGPWDCNTIIALDMVVQVRDDVIPSLAGPGGPWFGPAHTSHQESFAWSRTWRSDLPPTREERLAERRDAGLRAGETVGFRTGVVGGGTLAVSGGVAMVLCVGVHSLPAEGVAALIVSGVSILPVVAWCGGDAGGDVGEVIGAGCGAGIGKGLHCLLESVSGLRRQAEVAWRRGTFLAPVSQQQENNCGEPQGGESGSGTTLAGCFPGPGSWTTLAGFFAGQH